MKRLKEYLLKNHYRPTMELYYLFNSFTHSGDGYECPICGKTSNEFLSFNKRKDVQCPKCGSLERHRLVWLYLMDETWTFSDFTSILHIAPKFSLWKRFRDMKNIDYHTIDLDSPLAGIKGDITNMSMVADDQFDFVICLHVLEHIEDDRGAMKEIHRVLKDRGVAIFQFPISGRRTYENPDVDTDEKRTAHYGQSDHRRVYGMDCVKRLREAGFEVEVIDYVSFFPMEEIERYRLQGSGLIFVCRKEVEIGVGRWMG